MRMAYVTYVHPLILIAQDDAQTRIYYVIAIDYGLDAINEPNKKRKEREKDKLCRYLRPSDKW